MTSGLLESIFLFEELLAVLSAVFSFTLVTEDLRLGKLYVLDIRRDLIHTYVCPESERTKPVKPTILSRWVGSSRVGDYIATARV